MAPLAPSRPLNGFLPPVRSTLVLGALLASAALAGGAPARADAPSSAQLQALESALNSGSDKALAALLKEGPGLDPAQMESRRRLLREQFPDARWQLSAGLPLRDGQPTVTVKVDGTRRQGGATYRLQAEQQLALQTDGTRFNGQTVLKERSVLRSGDKPLPVSLLIPDAVLTGQRYDVDVIFDDPLDGALAAGGIAAITPAAAARHGQPEHGARSPRRRRPLQDGPRPAHPRIPDLGRAARASRRHRQRHQAGAGRGRPPLARALIHGATPSDLGGG